MNGVDPVLLACVCAVVGLVVGWLSAWLFFGRRIGGLSAELAAAARLADEKSSSHALMLQERDRRCAEVVAEKERAIQRLLAEKDREFAEMLRTLEARFAALASTTLEARSKSLLESNRISLDAAVRPLAEQLVSFQNATQKAQDANRDLGNSIHKDIETIGRYAKDLSDFSVAIKSGNAVQGRAGEDVLAEKLRQAGLEENVTFFLQEGTGSDRPDAQVCDAENRWLVIDSKVSMTAFVDFWNGRLDDDTRRQRLKDHVASVRRRIESLRDKGYPSVLAREHPDRNYLPVAAMFVPYEAALTTAVEADPSLVQLAMQGRVVLLTPTSLLAYLRLVYLAWQNRKVEDRYRDIVKNAEELLARMNRFLLAFEAVGTSLESARTQYAEARDVIVEHKGGRTIGGSARKLLEANIRFENRKGGKRTVARCLANPSEEAAEEPVEEPC